MEKDLVIKAQRMELSESIIYEKLAQREKREKNKKILQDIANDERKHYAFWKKITKKEVAPHTFMVFWYVLISKMLGLSFGLKLMERGERNAHKLYEELASEYKTKKLMQEEHEHEKKLLRLLKEERLVYAGSIVLGLNDALVELTGALAGLTFALRNGSLIALTGLVTGIAASLSMAASEYLSSREENNQEKSPGKGAAYTGTAYIITVLLLVLPFFLLENIYLALGLTLLIGLTIIAVFNFYFSVAKELSFWKRFLQMGALSLGVAAISFLVGLLLRFWLGVDV